MSWHTIVVEPKGGPPNRVWLEDGWYKIDAVGGPTVRPDGNKEYSFVIQRDSVRVLQIGKNWYMEGSGPDDKFY